jgi:hypothetical protein
MQDLRAHLQPAVATDDTFMTSAVQGRVCLCAYAPSILCVRSQYLLTRGDEIGGALLPP